MEVVIMYDQEKKKSRGFSFLSFEDEETVDRCVVEHLVNLNGKQIDPKPCNPRTLQKPKRSDGFPKVFLGGLPSDVTETDLRSYFTRFGKVMEVVIMYDQEKKKSRGDIYLRQNTGSSVPGFSSSSAKTPDYTTRVLRV
ncbi:heterogeneous nuclear ribonucleoprotein 27C-like [Formica exsecta]|uniref:heterogeneous nuclear ribonucleoprotein 27C-like n=1 Tax=Formica exsecta TaxID=72781 RepID=UPI0011420010|nr:heterogeneous nuclear ribonucleoprotein 27C-like [Formica exsecta]